MMNRKSTEWVLVGTWRDDVDNINYTHYISRDGWYGMDVDEDGWTKVYKFNYRQKI